MDYAGRDMTDEPLPLTHHQRLALTAADDPPPGWVWPSLVLGTALPALLASARRDADLLRRVRPAPGPGRLGRIGELPGLPAALLVGAALVLAVLFGFIRLGISDVYTESWLFLALALVLGLASPAAGLVLTLAFIPMDLLAAITRGTLDPLLPALAGQALTWWLLWLLAVALPLVARQVPAAVLATTRPAHPDVRRALGYVSAAAVVAGLVWAWCAAAVELVRPVFTWSSALANPAPVTTGPLLDGRLGLMLAAAFALVGWTLLRDAFRLIDDEAEADAAPPAWPALLSALPARAEPVRWVALAAAGLLLLGGMITAPVDVLLLGGALLVSRPGVRRLLRRFPVALLLLGQLPWLVRLAIGVLVAWVASTVLTLVLTGPALGSERLPIVVATAVSILVLALLLEVDGATDDLMADRDARAAARQAGPADDLADDPDLPDDEPVIALGPGPLPGDSQAAPAGPADPPRASIRGRSTGASLGRTVTSRALLVIPALVLPAVALAQGGAPCPVGETCLPAAGVSAATAAGAATMLALTFGAAGRFVSMRRDAAYRQDAGAAAGAPDAQDEAFPGDVTGRGARIRAAILAAWRAG